MKTEQILELVTKVHLQPGQIAALSVDGFEPFYYPTEFEISGFTEDAVFNILVSEIDKVLEIALATDEYSRVTVTSRNEDLAPQLCKNIFSGLYSITVSCLKDPLIQNVTDKSFEDTFKYDRLVIL